MLGSEKVLFKKRLLLLVLGCVFMLYAFTIVNAVVHEGLHVLIFRNYGVASNFNITWYGSGYAYIMNMTDYEQLATERKESLRDMQLLAEITGYNSNLSTLMIVAVLLLQLVFMMLGFSSMKKDDSMSERELKLWRRIVTG